MNINTLSIGSFQIELDYSDRGQFARTVYYDPSTDRYFKIWNKDYFYRPYFEYVYNNTPFFNEVSLIDDVITSEFDGVQQIWGYVTKKHKTISFDTVDSCMYQDFRERISNACLSCNVVYLDFVVHNIIEKDNKYYIIDLEATIPSNKLSEIPNLTFILEYNDYFYRKNIASLIPLPIVPAIRQHTCHLKPIKYGLAPGRVYLEQEYLPGLNGSVLFVGVNYYTDFYSQLVKKPNYFETLDISEDVIGHGSPYKHYVTDIRQFQGYKEYDNVCFFGIIGHLDEWDIIKEKDDILNTISVLNSVVAPGGTLLLGPATVGLSHEFWDEIYNSDVLSHYERLFTKQIDINYVWYGRKRYGR